jgi:hypothetical protein
MAKKKSERYVIVRCDKGVFAGVIDDKASTNECKVLTNARRIWQWYGAATLSQLAVDGTSRPSECKFPAPVVRIELVSQSYGFEVIDCTPTARKSIENVPVWKQ